LLLALASPASAQQTTGTPGSPKANTIIRGKQLPPPPPKFKGVIKEGAVHSEPDWPARVMPPDKAALQKAQAAAYY